MCLREAGGGRVGGFPHDATTPLEKKLVPTKARTQTMDRFFSDAAKGTLPALTWIAPRQGVNKTLGALGGPNSTPPVPARVLVCRVSSPRRVEPRETWLDVTAGPGHGHGTCAVRR